MGKKNISRYAPFFLALMSAIALSIESYLALNNSSLCPTEACKTVSTYITIKESIFVGLGAGAFWVLTLSLFFSERYPQKLKYVPPVLFTIAFTVDSSLIGFQYFTIEQKCVLCLSVALSLVIIAAVYCIQNRNFYILLIFALIWVSGFTTHSIYTMPLPNTSYERSAIVSINPPAPTQQSADHIVSPDITLIISMNCSHCLEVVKFLAKTHPIRNRVNIATVDTDKKSLQKLSLFLRDLLTTENPYKLLVDIKETTTVENIQVKKSLELSGKNTLNFLSNVGVTSIPVLIVEQAKNEKRIITGSHSIINTLVSFKNNSED